MTGSLKLGLENHISKDINTKKCNRKSCTGFGDSHSFEG